MDCENKNGNTCLLATSISGVQVTVDEATCNACAKQIKPKTLNTVICSIAYKASKNPKFLAMFNEFNNTHFNKPGSHLKLILQKIGIASPSNCGCDEYAMQMNLWGTQGCIARRQEIIDHLNSHRLTWMNMAKVAIAGYITTGAIVDESITRAKVIQ